MKGLFIINPSSGRQNFIDKIKEIAGMLVIDQICNTIDVFYTEKQDDALNKAAALEKGQYDFVVYFTNIYFFKLEICYHIAEFSWGLRKI